MYKIPASTLFLGKNLVFMPECHSTNSLALELCQQSAAPEGTLVITDRQTSGRGQRGNSWEALPGMNLTFSVVLKPTFLPVRNQFLLSAATSLAIHHYLAETCNASLHIKWPNDILANEFKICGILIENQVIGDHFASVIIGIGLNVNQKAFSSPTATSLSILTNQDHDLQVVLERLLSCLEAQYLQLREGKWKTMEEEYRKHLYRLNELHTFRSGEEHFLGRILGVDAYGRLRVLAGGREKTYDIKEISFLETPLKT